MSLRHPFLTLTSFLAASAAPCAERDATPSPDERIIEHVYVSTGAPAPGDRMVQAARIDVLEGLDKDIRQGASLGQSLEYLAGVRVLDTGNNAGIPVIRGLTGNRIRILSNGIGVDHQQYGIRHQPNIDPFLSQRIEVARGAASLLYGSDAIGGVIDVHGLPLDHTDDGSRRNELDTRIDYATNNDQVDLALRGASTGDRFTVSGGFAWREGQEIEAPDSATAFESGNRDDPAFTGTLPFTDFEQRNGQVGMAWRGERATTSLRLSTWNTEQNYLLPAPPDGSGIGIDLDNTELQLRTDYLLKSGATQWTLRPMLAWQNNRRRANQPGTPRSGLFDGDIEIEFDQYTARFEALHESEDGFKRGTLGFEIRQRDQESRGRTVLSPGGTVKSYGLFAYEERQFGLLLLQAGLRYDHIETEGDEGKTSATPSFSGTVRNSYDVVTGALGGSYPLNDNFTLAANAARGFRAPTLFEQFAQGVHGGVAAVQLGNPDLDPEQSLNLDLSLRWSFDRIRGDLTVYRNGIDDYIFLTDTGNQAPNGLPIFVHEQADATLTGVEAEIAVDLTTDWSLRFVLDLIDTENEESGDRLPLTPANELLTELTWQPASFLGLREPYARASLRYADAQDAAPGEPFQQFDRNPVFGSASTDSYFLVNFAAGASLPGPGKRDIRVNLELRNAFDESYRDFLNTYKGYALNPGRDLRLTLQIPLG